ncbi:hypothetical protein JYU34_009941 [Plutella xylostella]|uniref:Lipase n=1 Tax=Plutella xylostella TaxID=51655 RepID=A0ABQ7QKP6_PLUXY|nr:hypothetical protein JYU34_009941 [Plutella xylostella]
MDNVLGFVEYAAQYGYLANGYSVVTQDGYILDVYQLLSSQCNGYRETPVLMLQGLSQSSTAWLDAGPGESLAFLLADGCHDLWIGNFRGTTLGRKHVRLNPDKDGEFWDFSFDDMGVHDLPTTIDFILETTKVRKISFIGYSQGAAVMAVMCSEAPAHCQKVKTFIGLAPAIIMKNSRSAVRICSWFGNLPWSVSKLLGIHEVLNQGSLFQSLVEFVCHIPIISYLPCQALISLVDSTDPFSIRPRTFRRLFAHIMSGSSVKNYVRYCQMFRSDCFEKFDYGVEDNFIRYGSPRPPVYNLSKISLPVLLVTAPNDHIVDVKDVIWLHHQLPNSTLHVLEDSWWNHMDVAYSRKISTVLFPVVHKHLLLLNT